MSEAINLMLRQIVIRRGLPFEIKLGNEPNAEAALKKLKKLLASLKSWIRSTRTGTHADLFK